MRATYSNLGSIRILKCMQVNKQTISYTTTHSSQESSIPEDMYLFCITLKKSIWYNWSTSLDTSTCSLITPWTWSLNSQDFTQTIMFLWRWGQVKLRLNPSHYLKVYLITIIHNNPNSSLSRQHLQLIQMTLNYSFIL